MSLNDQSSAAIAKPRLAGLLPVFQTPFGADERIDLGGLAREIDWLFAHGADGVVMAMVSEVLRLTGDERRALAESACALVAGRGAVVISVGAESSFAAADAARHAAGCGASALMAIPPLAVAVGEAEIAGYYRRILDAVELPVVVQDASGYVGKPLSIALQASLFQEYGERVMFKPEAAPIGQRLSLLRDATGGAAAIFEGTGGVSLVDSHRRGIAGTMPGADLIVAVSRLWRALEDGDRTVVDAIHPALCAVLAHENSLDAFLAVEKHLLVRQGVFSHARVRGPVGYALDPETIVEVDRLFEGLMAIVAGLSRPLPSSVAADPAVLTRAASRA